MRLLLAGLLLTLSFGAAAQVYSYTDANGNTAYTNEPPPGSDAQSVDVPPTNGASVPPNVAAPVPAGNAQQLGNPAPSYNAAPAPQTQVTINPNDDSADDDNGGYDNNSNNNNEDDNTRRDERGIRRP